MRPFVDYALEYLKKGWQPFPLPRAAKWPPPEGVTGRYGDIRLKDVEDWINSEEYLESNIGIRVPIDVVGLDVDNYGNKKGGETLAELESRWGVLPECPISTAREDGISGIRFFRCSRGLVWPGSLGSGIDVIQYRHRYAVAFPSIHPDLNAVYRWLVGKGRIPRVSSLLEIPERWKAGVDLREYVERQRTEVIDSAVWLEDLGGNRGKEKYCRLMERGLKDGLAELEEAESQGIGAHDVLNRRTYNLIALGAEGHSGVVGALGELTERFKDIVCNRSGGQGKGGLRRSKVSAEGEVRREIEGAVRIIAAEGELKNKCSCSSGSSLIDVSEYKRNDIGNAKMFLDIVNTEGQEERVVWDPVVKAFMWLSDSGLWIKDAPELHKGVELVSEQLYSASAAKAAEFMELSAGMGELSTKYKEDPAAEALRVAANKLYIHAERAGDSHKGKAMLEKVAVYGPQESQWDTDGRLLSVGDGKVVELTVAGSVVRELIGEDRVSKKTAVGYVGRDDARSKLLEDYWDTFIPDLELRSFVQRLLGYSLLGGNPEKLLVFFYGGTGSGKSTLLDMVVSALGPGYGCTFPPSVFRESQEEKARADMLKINHRRIAYLDEVSSKWNLHADRLKRIVGGGRMSDRGMYVSGEQDLIPMFTPFVTTNVIAQIQDADQATLKRLLVVPFNEQVGDKENVGAREKLCKDSKVLKSMLVWLVKGWDLYCEKGLKEADWPALVVRATAEFRGDVNEFQRWFKESCVIQEDSWTVYRYLLNSYATYCHANGIKNEDTSDYKFAKTLDSMGIKGVKKHIPKNFEDKNIAGKTRDIRLCIRLISKKS